MTKSKKSVEAMKDKIQEIEKIVAEINRNIEELFNRMEDQRQATVENQRALANLVTGRS